MEKQLENLTHEALIEYILHLETDLQKKQAAYGNLTAEHGELQAKYGKLQNEHTLLNENFEKLRKMIFGRSSEKGRFIDDASQLSFLSCLFNEAEAFAAQAGKEELSEIQVPEHTRKKKRSRKELLASLPVFEVLCDTEEEDRVCGACGEKTRYLGKEHVRDEIEIVPAQMYINRYSRVNYVCDECHKDEGQARIIKSDVPAPVIKHSLASPSAVANVIYQKFVNSMPIARQEKDWQYQGVYVGRATLGNWVLKASREHLIPIYELMKEELLKASVIAADETDVKVMKEEGREPSQTSKMWVYRTIDEERAPPIVLFEYQPGRHGEYAAKFLKGWSGYLMTDAYQGYDAVAGADHCYCWAHTRRYWHKALPKNTEGSKAKIGFDYCDKLFELERKWKGLSAAERLEKRKSESKPVLDKYFAWVESLDYLVGSNLGKAAEYSINNKAGLLGFLNDGAIEISTNRLEGNIRKFVIGRNNFITIDTVAGAKASAVCYSIVITAIENGLNVYEYLKHLFHELPKRRKNKDAVVLENYLPWSESLPQECYMKNSDSKNNQGQLIPPPAKIQL
jgi:transposase